MMRGTAWVSWSKWNCGRDLLMGFTSWNVGVIMSVPCRDEWLSNPLTVEKHPWAKAKMDAQKGLKRWMLQQWKDTRENSRDMLRHVRQCCDISEQSFVLLRDIGWYFQCGAWTDRYHRWLQNRQLFAIACGIVHAVRCIKASLCSSLAQPGDRSWVHGVKHTHTQHGCVEAAYHLYSLMYGEKNSWC